MKEEEVLETAVFYQSYPNGRDVPEYWLRFAAGGWILVCPLMGGRWSGSARYPEGSSRAVACDVATVPAEALAEARRVLAMVRP